jgi:hypothetical protein
LLPYWACPLSAGLLAILGVDVTKKRGLRSVSIRILASVVTRAEFEVRSALLQLVLELKGYLTVAKKKKNMKPSAS